MALLMKSRLAPKVLPRSMCSMTWMSGSTSLTPCDARLEQHAEVGPVGDAAGDGVVARGLAAAVAAVEQHAGRDLVADLHHVGTRARRDQLGDRVLRVVVNRRRQGGDRGQALPGDGHALLAGIGPVVAVVKVEQESPCPPP